MKEFSDYELTVIRRAVLLLSFIVEGRDTSDCMHIVEKIMTEIKNRKMFGEEKEGK